MTYGSLCSGIEAAHLAFNPLGFKQLWSSEIAEFPRKVLKHHYPQIPNHGDMTKIPSLIREGKVETPDLICGGTPCQAFSLAGLKKGLEDTRGQLTLTFIKIADEIDIIRKKKGEKESLILWENVEGVLNDKTNAFGFFLAGLGGFDEEIKVKKWTKSGYLEGPKRNIVWRVLDAKFFGLPQQRKRLYVVASGKDTDPSQILLELSNKKNEFENLYTTSKRRTGPSLFNINKQEHLKFYKNDNKIQYFRDYTDCLYAAYGTKWNGNAAAFNGSLFVSQNDRIRRLTPLECERLMGIPDEYTNIPGNSLTSRYKAIGNSWAVPVIKWIGEKITLHMKNQCRDINWKNNIKPTLLKNNFRLFLFNKELQIDSKTFINPSLTPNNPKPGLIEEIFQIKDIPSKLYLSPTACKGIIRRKNTRNARINLELESLLLQLSVDENTHEAVNF
ncbi:DNA cytosine methyltransferase [Tenacibaculum mesophilum]|uniref:DNA cytosine methyltransferase n=1 Tax=Tenacibaculum mesophilum TaxID=104268 RepID=UPI00249331B4|nr:DNA (cytosine-5-)-methyltransferase [Tenacibaculum mesophilum]